MRMPQLAEVRDRLSFCRWREFCVNCTARRLERYVSPRMEARMEALRLTLGELHGTDEIVGSSTALALQM